MTGLVPVIHAVAAASWMAGTSPAMTRKWWVAVIPPD